jgi:hypothetical protein
MDFTLDIQHHIFCFVLLFERAQFTKWAGVQPLRPGKPSYCIGIGN